MLTGRFEDARDFYTKAIWKFDQEPMFPYYLALVLANQGETERAIVCLEESIAPSCRMSDCGQSPKHLPSLRFLTRLYLEQGNAPRRAHELLDYLTQELAGRLSREDYLLMASYHEQVGDAEGAQAARIAARETPESPAEAFSSKRPNVVAGQYLPDLASLGLGSHG